jgi:nuclear GTP-binding protein
MVINDFLRGKVPWYIPDPSWPERKAKEKDEEEFGGDEGRLGEMRLKVGKNDTQAGDSESWDGLDVESNDDEDREQVEDDSQLRGANRDNDLEDDRIEDPRPPKKVRVS